MATENLARPQSSGQIRLDNRIPVFFLKIQRRRAFGAPGGIDQNVYLAESIDAFVQDFLHRFPVGHVRSNTQSFSPALFDFRRRGFDLLEPSRSGYDISSGFSQTVCDSPPDAARSADNNRCFSV